MPNNRRREVIIVATLSLKKGVRLADAKSEVRDRVNAECGDPSRRDIRIKRLTRYTPPKGEQAEVVAWLIDGDYITQDADVAEIGRNQGHKVQALGIVE